MMEPLHYLRPAQIIRLKHILPSDRLHIVSHIIHFPAAQSLMPLTTHYALKYHFMKCFIASIKKL
ncbi:hypothetical protein D9M69_590080 [compost metagenome]